MEPHDLNSSGNEEARLDALLRQRVPQLLDDGFTRRVLAALPPPVSAHPFIHRAVFCTVGAVIGLTIALAASTSGTLTNFPGANELGQTFNNVFDLLSMPTVALALAVAVGSLMATLWSDVWVRVWRF
jgi:hypothetical protein